MKEYINDSIDLRRYLRMIRRGRWFYIVCLSLAIILSIVYALFSSPVYRNHTEVMIEKESMGGGAGLSGLLSGNASMANLFAMSGLGNSSIDDEMLLMSSNRNYVNVSRLLQLNRTYTERQGLHKKLLYKESPIRVEAPAEYFDTLSEKLRLVVELEGNNRFSAHLKRGFLSLFTVAEVEHQTMPYTLHSEWGDLLIVAADSCAGSQAAAGRKVRVDICSNQKAAYVLTKEVEVDVVDKKANAVRISYKHPEKTYAYDVLSAITASYSIMRNEHKHHSSLLQVEFFDKRIGSLLSDLDSTQTGFKQFMSDRKLVSLEGQTAVLLARSEELRDRIKVAESRLYVSQEILNLLQREPEDYPSIAIGADSGLVKQYNELVQQRLRLMRSAKTGNLMLDETEMMLREMRQLIIDNMHQEIAQSKMLLNSMKNYRQQSDDKLGQMPDQGLDFANHARDLELKNQLLLFLMQQRENALMDMTKETEAGFVYEPPYSEKNKDYTKKLMVAILLLFMAVAGPTTLLWGWMAWKDKLVDDSDLTSPILRQHGRSTVRQMRRLIMTNVKAQQLHLQALAGGEKLKDEFLQLVKADATDLELIEDESFDKLMYDSHFVFDEKSLLVLFVPSGAMKRKELAKLLSEADLRYVYVLVG